jgi:outer membrane protein OmpA-like peptidoglycan-associated protein
MPLKKSYFCPQTKQKNMNKFIFTSRSVSVVLTICILLGSCKSMNQATKGAIIGTLGGAAAGAAVGKATGNTAVGAIIGAAVGGTAGVLIGRYMDKQAAELKKDLEGAEIERVGEGIKITFRQGIQFTTGSYELSPSSKTNLTDLAGVLKKYEDTNILIEGHTDSTGDHDKNMTLSNNRATSVSTFLQTLAITPARVTTKGYGPDQPIGDNATDGGRQQNRRVEVAIFANEKLKKKAEKGEI